MFCILAKLIKKFILSCISLYWKINEIFYIILLALKVHAFQCTNKTAIKLLNKNNIFCKLLLKTKWLYNEHRQIINKM